MDDNLLTLRFSLQRALLGEVTKNLIAVTAGIKDSTILIRAYFDEHANEAEMENVRVVGAEVISDFPDTFGIEEQIMISSPQGEMEMLDFWAFLRSIE